MPIYITVAVIGFTILIFILLFLLRRGSKRRAILICGPSDSGKTILFSQLVYGKQVCFILFDKYYIMKKSVFFSLYFAQSCS